LVSNFTFAPLIGCHEHNEYMKPRGVESEEIPDVPIVAVLLDGTTLKVFKHERTTNPDHETFSQGVFTQPGLDRPSVSLPFHLHDASSTLPHPIDYINQLRPVSEALFGLLLECYVSRLGAELQTPRSLHMRGNRNAVWLAERAERGAVGAAQALKRVKHTERNLRKIDRMTKKTQEDLRERFGVFFFNSAPVALRVNFVSLVLIRCMGSLGVDMISLYYSIGTGWKLDSHKRPHVTYRQRNERVEILALPSVNRLTVKRTYSFSKSDIYPHVGKSDLKPAVLSNVVIEKS
jgi:hypothetical protein